ncbi:type IV pilus twitching motility protein PilT [Chitinivibrio alkaliphilus]|uniref:Type IV pilus retraction ATPase PilT n=1 Tax=Chitinivibrio alkaliphilus ACht1 TaxID=1313304 RepID=U7D9X5_9BACT|nr:type IV pilus twitching motility protein PilT [Chitinivibrio alkaliphilus]ERP31230.1 type IV pilus retraction ATPase PilT [Chitinivibrio alkaliphilus ACht1]
MGRIGHPKHIDEILERGIGLGASDVHLSQNAPAVYRVHGTCRMSAMPPFSGEEIQNLIFPLLSTSQQDALEKYRSVDFAYSYKGGIRFRVNVFFQRGYPSAVLRQLPDVRLDLATLGLPSSVGDFARCRDGLVLVTGPTGSGKTTTLATLIDAINEQQRGHIITIEDPVEFLHEHKKCLVTQRELHTDVPSFASALRDSLREDPDVILVGEMRDIDTIRTAIMASETGHLVFSTLHSRDAVSTLMRMVNVFPVAEQQQVRQQLSGVLKGVVSQQLIPCISGESRHAAVEVMQVTTAIANMVRLGKYEQIYSLIETGTAQGMQTLEMSLLDLYGAGKISRDAALRMAKNAGQFSRRLDMVSPEVDQYGEG